MERRKDQRADQRRQHSGAARTPAEYGVGASSKRRDEQHAEEQFLIKTCSKGQHEPSHPAQASERLGRVRGHDRQHMKRAEELHGERADDEPEQHREDDRFSEHAPEDRRPNSLAAPSKVSAHEPDADSDHGRDEDQWPVPTRDGDEGLLEDDVGAVADLGGLTHPREHRREALVREQERQSEQQAVAGRPARVEVRASSCQGQWTSGH